MRLYELIVHVCDKALNKQRADGSFPEGVNGPYGDRETPVRNTAHFSIALQKAYQISGHQKYVDAAYRAAQYLCQSSARPMNGSFFCRMNPEKDLCNGLIGQAWAIEALASAANFFQESQFYDVAKSVFNLHPFDAHDGLWRRLAVDGSYLSYDLTFNHQLWFAASGAQLAADDDEEIKHKILYFLERAEKRHMQVSARGRIFHVINRNLKPTLLNRSSVIIRPYLRSLRRNQKMVHKEVGYHAFNLYAFALIFTRFPDASLWHTPKFDKVLKFIQHKSFYQALDNNPYSYPYNPTGFEVAYTIQTFATKFSEAEKRIKWWLSQQLIRTFSTANMVFEKDTPDPHTLTARVYEAARLNDSDIGY